MASAGRGTKSQVRLCVVCQLKGGELHSQTYCVPMLGDFNTVRPATGSTAEEA